MGRYKVRNNWINHLKMFNRILFLFLMMMTLPYAGISQCEAFRVMTFNIRFDDPDAGVNSWDNRKQMVGDVIAYHHPKIIGFQEALHHQVTDLDSLLPGYHWIGLARDDGRQKGEYSPVFYDTARFTLRESNTYWLGENPGNPGEKGWDAAFPRVVTWGYFYDKVSQKSFYLFNTHFAHQGTIARLESAKLMLEKAEEMTGGKSWIPVIFTGDFNSLQKSGPYQLLTHWDNPVKLRDTRNDSTASTMGPDCTYIGFGQDFKEDMIIDYIFVNEALNVHKHLIITDNKNGRYPSDHLPVVAEISFKK
jgi:endonuclease/exonuclease/phosphatase family metal-dependent hydrolase